MLTIGSLFAGIGGLELGLEWAGLGPVRWQVERNAYCRSVLARHWPNAARTGNVKLFHPDRWGRRPCERERVDLICGGFPCQDVSGAGKGAGLAGARSGLWREFARVVGEFEPRWVVVENVASGANRWVDAVVRDLAELGYASLPLPVSASDVGAPHRRARIFVVARRVRNASREQERDEQQRDAGRHERVRHKGPGLALQLGAEVADGHGVDGATRNADARQERAGRPVAWGSGAPLAHGAGEPERQPLPLDAGPTRRDAERDGAMGDGDGDGREAQRRGGLLDRERPAFGHDVDGSSGPWPWPPAPGDADGWRDYIAAGGPQPAVCRNFDGLSARMVDLDADAKERRPEPLLQGVFFASEAEALERALGRSRGVPEKEVLRPEVHGQGQGARQRYARRLLQESASIPQAVMRAMRDAGAASRSPQGSELAQQRTRELDDAVRVVSHVAASCGGGHQPVPSAAAMSCLRRAVGAARSVRTPPSALQEIWRSASDEEVVGWLVDACLRARRRHWERQLKALGNAVCPSQAEVVGWVVRELEGQR